ncbi:MAG: phosphoribosylaminoimidazolesuccinocarboxamide synthase [Peptostreptococcaceae bacterium]|nr:phosphoribosylaminoimidazolesuccinocarboxamide synthase [Peptostreptococcaceae bacterium]
MKKLEMIYEGKAKKVYKTDDADRYIVEYKDDATAFNGVKKGTITGKGVINNKMSAVLFEMLEKEGIPTHFEGLLSDRETLVKAVKIVPLEVIMRNIAAGSLAKRLGLKEGTPMKRPVLEFCYKDDELGDPIVNEDHILAVELATEDQLKIIKEYAYKINELLMAFFKERKIRLVDFKIELGVYKGKIILADEISPDTCRLWDWETDKKLDKDRFRRDLGGVEDAYEEIFSRISK